MPHYILIVFIISFLPLKLFFAASLIELASFFPDYLDQRQSIEVKDGIVKMLTICVLWFFFFYSFCNFKFPFSEHHSYLHAIIMT